MFLSVKHCLNKKPVMIILLCIAMVNDTSLIFFPHVVLEPLQHQGLQWLSESKDNWVEWDELNLEPLSSYFSLMLLMTLDDPWLRDGGRSPLRVRGRLSGLRRCLVSRFKAQVPLSESAVYFFLSYQTKRKPRSPDSSQAIMRQPSKSMNVSRSY